jgi:hypothetical protein
MIFAHLPLTELFAIRQTDSRFAQFVAIEFGNRVTGHLRPYIKKVNEFLTVLGHCKGIITGSVALHIVLLQTRYTDGWSPSNVDIHLPLSTYSCFLSYLLRKEKYYITDSPVSNSCMDYIFCHRLKHPDRNVFIDLACSNEESAVAALPLFWSSHLFNYITASSIEVAYPNTTLRGIGCLSTFRSFMDEDEKVDTIGKYTSRGFSIQTFSEVNTTCTNTNILEDSRRYSCAHKLRSEKDSGFLRVKYY